MRRLPLLMAGAMGGICGFYTIVYLYRWEWNRAAIAALFFVATELIVATGVILRRLRRIEQRLDRMGEAPTGPTPDHVPDHVAAALRDHRPEPHDHFSWLRDSAGSTNVFLPVLLGLGVVASGLAWVVEQAARATASPALEHRLARRLAPITPPAGGLLTAPVTVPASADRRGAVRRGVAIIAAVLAAGAASAASIDYLADEIQTRPDDLRFDVETVLDLELRGAAARDDPQRVFSHLWAICTAPGNFSDRLLAPSSVQHGTGGAVRVVVPESIGEHGIARLTGCLRDTTLDRVQASVVNVRTVGS